MPKTMLIAMLIVSTASIGAQSPPAARPPAMPAIDITHADIKTFLDKLPKDAISDSPIRVVDVGGHRVGVYGVFRPKAAKQDAVLHEVVNSEIYYMLEGAATLVTGGTMVDERRQPPPSTLVRASRIDNGVSRRIVPGDVVIIPGGTPHWWSSLETDIRYLIVRPDPANRIPLK
jgi:mannose-6-phosphate isomerase-like protein (cupin superfamily)